MSTVTAESRHDLTDAQWNVLKPLLPAPSRFGRPRRYTLRDLLNGVRHRIRVGGPWRDVPARYGPWWRVYALFRSWQLSGTWTRIEAELQFQADAQENSGGTSRSMPPPAGRTFTPPVPAGTLRNASTVNLLITHSAGRGAGSPPRSTWRVTSIYRRCRLS